MGRVFKYWLALAPLAVITSYAVQFLMFRQVDLTFAQFATLLSVPLIQASVFAWRAARPANALAALAWSVARHPLAQPVLLLDGLVLGAGVVGWDSRVIGFGAFVNIHSTWILVKGAAAVAFCVAALLRSNGRERMTIARRVGAPLLLLFAVEPSTSWLAASFARVHAVLGPRAEVVQRLAFYGPVFSILVGLTLRSARGLARQSREAGQLLQVAIALSIALAVTVVLASFNLPIVTQPWLGFATLFASCAATSGLLAALFLATAGPSRPEGS